MAKGKQTAATTEGESALPPIRVREQMHAPVQEGCKKLVMTPTEFVNQAVREKLEREGLWPINLTDRSLAEVKELVSQAVKEMFGAEGSWPPRTESKK